jgi:hypothetical protein
MGDKWISTRRGRAAIAVGAAVVASAIVIAVVASGDSGTTNDVEVAVPSDSTTTEPGSTTSTPTSDPVDTTAASMATPTVAETDDSGTPATMATVPVGTVEVRDPIPLDETGDFGTGLSVQLVGIEAIEGEARTQGEISGPALRIELELTNDSDEAISLEQVQVEVTYGEERTPGIELTGSGTVPFPESVAPDDSTTGTVVFVVPADQRDLVQIVVTQTTGAPIIVFEGSAP